MGRKGRARHGVLEALPLSLVGVQLLVNGLELLVEILLLAADVHLSLDLCVEPFLDAQNLQLTNENLVENPELVGGLERLQELLLFRDRNEEVPRDDVPESHPVPDPGEGLQDIGGDAFVQDRVLFVHAAHPPNHRLHLRPPGGPILRLDSSREFELGPEGAIGGVAAVLREEVVDSYPSEPLHDDPGGPIGEA